MPTQNLHFGQIISFAPNERGGFYLVLTRGPGCKRVRADSRLFSEAPQIGSIVSFIIDDKAFGKLPKAANVEVISIPERTRA